MRFAASFIVLAGLLACGGGKSPQAQEPATTTPEDTTTTAAVDADKACTTDADCVLTEYQSECCAQACEPYAINKTVIDKRIEAERGKCDEQRASGVACPPPADCELPNHTVVGAKCENNVCETVTKPGFGAPR
jgi:hypothetical protein